MRSLTYDYADGRRLAAERRATQDIAAGPVATVHMPYKVVGQVHGLWVQGYELPKHA